MEFMAFSIVQQFLENGNATEACISENEAI